MDAFDKHMKSVFEDHEIQVDTDELWSKVEPALRRRRFPYFMIFLFIFGAMIVGSFIYLDKIEGKGSSQQTEKIAYDQSIFGRKGQLIKNVSSVKKGVNEITEEIPANKKNEIIVQTKNQRTDSKIQLKKQNFFPIDLTKGNDKKAESNVNTIINSETVSGSRELYSTKKVATNTMIQPVIPLSFLTAQIPFSPKANFGKFRLSLDLFGGGGFTQKYLMAKSFDFEWYKKEREHTEKFLETFDVGLQLQLNHSSGFFAGTGLVYRQTDELFMSESSTEIRSFTEGVIEIVTNADGSWSEVTGQKLVINQKSWNKKKYNNYTFINLPAYIGYGFSYKMLRFELNTGVDLNLLFLKEGEIIGDEGFPVSVSESQSSIFRKRTSVNLIGSFKLLYPISDQFIIYTEPNFQYNVYSITSKYYPLEQRYLHTGIRIGTRFIF